MPQLLSIIAAALYGVADFAGGLAARGTSPWRVTAWSQLIGVPLLLLAVAVAGTTGASTRDLLLGSVAGIFGLAGLVFLYSALSKGTMSVVAPIIGALSAALAVAWDIATGGTIGALQWMGIAVAVVAVLLLSSQESVFGQDMRPIGEAVVSAIAFAVFFIAISYTRESSGVWPLVSARVITIPVAFLVAARLHAAAIPNRSTLPLVAFTGLTDMGASLAIVLALQRGSLGLNTMLSSLYPAFTVLAAFVILKERPSGRQSAGIALALIGAVLLAS